MKNENDKTEIAQEVLKFSKRAKAVKEYFLTDAFIRGAADKIRQNIVEGGREWTTFTPDIKGASLSGGLGAYMADSDYLAATEKKLKEIFPAINHLRFEIEHSFPTVMIDTKPLTWWRKKTAHPARTGGFG